MVAAEKAAQEADRQQRIQEEATAIAEHNAREKEQREEFEYAFRNVWSTGPTGLSQV